MRLWPQLREDWLANDRSWTRAGFHALAVHRIGAWQANLPRRGRPLAGLAYGPLYWFVRNVYGIEIPRKAKVGRRLRLPHQGVIVVNGDAQIGDDCLIEHNVTIGADAARGAVPRIGNRVHIGSGATIVGPITIGDDARVGANALVMTDVPSGATAAAPPARVIGGAIDPQARDRLQSSTGSKEADPWKGSRPLLEVIRATIPVAAPLDERTPLLSSGLIDSFQLVVLVDALEEEYGIRFSTEDLSSQSLDTPEQIRAMVERARR